MPRHPADEDTLFPRRSVPAVLLVLIVVLFALLLSGCAGDMSKLKSTSTAPVCKALIGPIKYNSTKPSSDRFAGKKLAPDLKQRNQVGVGLGCPAYR